MAQPPKEEEKKELPPIEKIACSEAEFKRDRLGPVLEEIKEEVKVEDFGEKTPLAKAIVMKLWDKSLKREELTDVVFTPFFNEIPKAEEGKDDVTVADAVEHLILRAI